MRTLLKILVSLVVIGVVLLTVAWVFRTRILAYYISQSLNQAPVSVERFAYQDQIFRIDNLVISNLGSRDQTAFSAREAAIYASWSDLTRRKIVVKAIDVSDIFFNIEFYRNGGSNWDRLLEDKRKDRKKTASRPYLIQELTLKNLSVRVTNTNGQVVNYPIIPEIVLYNISNETGFPFHEVEKAIFRLVLQKLIEDFGIKTIENVIKNIVPDPSNLPFFGN